MMKILTRLVDFFVIMLAVTSIVLIINAQYRDDVQINYVTSSVTERTAIRAYDNKWQTEINRKVAYCYTSQSTLTLVHKCLWKLEVWI